ELFHLIQSEIRLSGFADMLAAGMVLTGGTSKMEGVVELAEEIFHMPVRIGMPHDVSGLSDIVQNPTYSTAVGLLLYGMKQSQERDGHTPSRSSGIRILDKVKRILFRDD
ncbi:MAG TPA: cell division protein FtsA, partial [Pseudomonadaceae bacterium]|nr:cell division protein FtsA [Pseudomonadaceae bacterium]